MQKITPHLWFDKEAEQAAQLYTSVFQGGKIGTVTRYTDAGHEVHGMEPGTVMTVDFQIEGLGFVALNGGPAFKFTPAISFMVHCPTKEEVDDLWNKLSEGGKALMPLDAYPFSERYGWTEDRFGLSWQIIHMPGIPQRKIVPSMLFTNEVAGKAEEAMQLYTSVFKDGEMGDISRYGAGQEPDKEGTVAYGTFTLAGQQFAAMDSTQSHAFTFTEALSFLVLCDSQEEADYFSGKLSAVPEAEQCGWLKDRYGVSWQIVPKGVQELLNGPDPKKAKRAMTAMLKMKRLDVGKIREAYEGKS